MRLIKDGSFESDEWLGWSLKDGRDYWRGRRAGPPWREDLRAPQVKIDRPEKPAAWSWSEIQGASPEFTPELWRALMIVRKYATTHSRARLIAEIAFGEIKDD
jgi:hypothetical protein